MTKMFKVLGKRGRVTIPLEVREELGYWCNDILSFTTQDNGTLLIKKEKICDNCIVQFKAAEEQKKDSDSIMELLDSLPDSQQRDILIRLSVKWAEKESGNGGRMDDYE